MVLPHRVAIQQLMLPKPGASHTHTHAHLRYFPEMLGAPVWVAVGHMFRVQENGRTCEKSAHGSGSSLIPKKAKDSMAMSQNRGIPQNTPKYNHPYYRRPQKGYPLFSLYYPNTIIQIIGTPKKGTPTMSGNLPIRPGSCIHPKGKAKLSASSCSAWWSAAQEFRRDQGLGLGSRV